MTQVDCIKKAKELGFEAIEFTELRTPEGIGELEYADVLRKTADEHNMIISAYAVCGNFAVKGKDKIQAEIKRLKNCVDVAAKLGAKFMRHDVMSDYKEFSSFDEALPTIAEATREVCEYAETKGIMTLIENHGQICQDPDRIERLIAAVNHKNYGLLLDTGNFLCADVSPVYAVSRLAHLVKMVHLKDAKVIPFGTPTEYNLYETRACNKLDFVVPGTGDANINQIFAILKKSGFDGHVDVEYEGRQDSVEALGKTIENLKNIL
jgi:sugar phosphate isomerase/epimerase